MRKDKQVELVFYFVGAVFIAWLSVLVAPCIHEGLFDAIIYLNEAMNSPFSFELCQDTLKCILIFESIYSFSYIPEFCSHKYTKKPRNITPNHPHFFIPRGQVILKLSTPRHYLCPHVLKRLSFAEWKGLVQQCVNLPTKSPTFSWQKLKGFY